MQAFIMQSKYHKKNYKNLSNIFSFVIFKNIVTFVGVLVVDVRWGGLLVNVWKTLTIYSLLFYSRSVGQYQEQRHDIISRVLTNQMRIQDW